MMKYIKLIMFGLLLATLSSWPVQAGEPTGKIGTMNPAMFKCVDKDGFELFQPDPFRKVTELRYIPAGEDFLPEAVEEYLDENSSIQEKTCDNDIPFDFGFNPTDSEEFKAYLRDIESDCDEFDGKIVPIRDTKIEGFVYEFHPTDAANPAESDWFAVPSRNVPVIAKGITFEIFWNSNDEGYYYFPNLGAGPIILNLKLPPDAHPINPHVTVFSAGIEETWTVFLGFYRGDTPPSDISRLRTPGGNFLPFTNLADLEMLSQCGYMDLPNVAKGVLSVSQPPDSAVDIEAPGMPDVGGVLPSQKSISTTILAAIIIVILPAGGILKLLRQSRSKNTRT